MYLPRPTLDTSRGLAPILLVAALASVATAMAARTDAQDPTGARVEPAGAAPGTEDYFPGTAADSHSEEEVKAAFLFHFATYAEWPPDAPHDDITFAILGAPSIAGELERFARDRDIHGQPVNVRRIRSLAALGCAEVLFIGPNHNDQLSQLIKQVDGPTLIVTDAPELPGGAMINFQVVDEWVRFEIGLPAVQRVGLTLSSRLLSAALRVEMGRCHVECAPA